MLIVGAGAAGLTCALRATMLGVNVTLLERQLHPLTTQLGVTTRWLDPTEFDWPHPHWRAGTMARGSTRYALRFDADDADALAYGWTSLLTAARYGLLKLRGVLEYYWGVDARRLRYPKARGGVGVAPWLGYPKDTRPFGAAISCIGFSGERTSVESAAGGALIGPAFWSTDALEERHLGIRHHVGLVSALVSGGGDGAQQDFLRILTGMFGKRLADALDLPTKARQLPLVDALMAEDAALRAYAWRAPGVEPLQSLHSWHRAFESCAELIWRWWCSRSGGLPLHVLRADTEATWLVGADAASYSYGLNRLLALLVARLHAHAADRPYRASARRGSAPARHVVLYGYRLDSVTPTDPTTHACGAACCGHVHQANLMKIETGSITGLGQFDVTIIRHGIRQRPLFEAARVSEQRVPYDAPG